MLTIHGQQVVGSRPTHGWGFLRKFAPGAVFAQLTRDAKNFQ
jgi:hypothetical protein